MIQLTPKWRKRWARFKWRTARKFRVLRRKVFPAYRRIQRLEWELADAEDKRVRSFAYAEVCRSRAKQAELTMLLKPVQAEYNTEGENE